uniref:Putative secreted protein n=1 Tax=Anopheles darlingi TaxID=43151 RepID=A0A2M4D1W6_ANODA
MVSCRIVTCSSIVVVATGTSCAGLSMRIPSIGMWCGSYCRRSLYRVRARKYSAIGRWVAISKRASFTFLFLFLQ